MTKIVFNLLSFSELKYYGVGVYFRDLIAKILMKYSMGLIAK